VKVEINPQFAVDAKELKAKLPAGTTVDSDKYFE